VRGAVLDYGCGHGYDAETYGWHRYDPHFWSVRPSILFDTILCTYVLNVVPDKSDRSDILADIRSMLHSHGAAYITVRNDKSKLNGWTKLGTWQGLIDLSHDYPTVLSTAGYKTYRMNCR